MGAAANQREKRFRCLGVSSPRKRNGAPIRAAEVAMRAVRGCGGELSPAPRIRLNPVNSASIANKHGMYDVDSGHLTPFGSTKYAQCLATFLNEHHF